MRRYEMSEAQWRLLAPLLPTTKSRGGRWRDHRQVLNGLLWRLRSGAAWREIPERYGPWQTLYERFRRWQRDGTWDRILQALQIRLDARGEIAWDLWGAASTSIRASRAAAGAGEKGDQASPRITRWAARAADGGPRSAWLLTVVDSRSRPRSPQGNATSRRRSTHC